ncbi:hypothetical protein [Methylobacterium brachythecii]|uniref:Uncharacterized protein n=1 Tax=Methylobacterium brachythecii TaxID=1176177 RepID=A0A7W6F886_9HYPH|nr:hypothetical protein [Methylobacterium brachythecii]MBB3904237.1 hypothetical protein [Methylobacterium brachythecii]GLS45101.1 hypothetical protein GCM10007884_30900 [Methylobacterium brachythecii]
MRTHVFKMSLSVTIGEGASSSLTVLLSYRVRFGDEVEILTARVLGEDAPIWLLRRIENDRTLIRKLLAHAAEDVAFDRRRAEPVEIRRAA